jgi:hypothetical protein
MNRLLPLVVPLVVLGCSGEVPVPGKERIGNFQLISVDGGLLDNDCSPLMVPDAGVPIDGGVILSVTYNNTTSPDGGHELPDGGPIQPYDAGFLTQSDGSGSEYGVIVGQVLDVRGDSPRVFASCNCPSVDPPDIVVHERNVLAVLSDSQVRALNPDGGKACPPLEVLLDGGIPPVGGTILPPRSDTGVWSVSLVCAVNLIEIEVLGTICDPGCVSCSLSNAMVGYPVAP